MYRWLSICTFLFFGAASHSLVAQETATQTTSQVPSEISEPSNARELFMLRKFYDQTVWRDERLAEQYERWVVGLWNSFLYSPNKWEVVTSASVDELIVGKPVRGEPLDWDILPTRFESPAKLKPAQWKAMAGQLQAAGYEILETEWHHSEFIPSKDGQPAKSVISMLMHVVRPKENTRYIVRGNLKFVWSTKKQGQTFLPASIDCSDVVILERKGLPAFKEVFSKAYQLGSKSTSLGTMAIHPVMLFDLNGDHLPEVVVAGQNKVYWNRGDWKFDEAELCKFPSANIAGGALGDFTGDGIADFFCGVQLGMPKLYVGNENGGFVTTPRELPIASKNLRLPNGITAGDIDHDGDLDVFIGQNKIGYQTGEIPDPYYDANDSFPSFLLLNDGKGNFRDVTAFSGLAKKRNRRNFSSSFIDLNHDGHLDLLMTNDFCGNDLFLGDGKGVFKDVTSELTPRSTSHGMSHTFADFNLDGKMDFLTIGMSSTTARRLDKLQLGRPDRPEHNRQRKHMGYGNRMYLQGEAGSFQQASFNASVARTGWSWGSTTLDFDRDGDPDVYVVNGQTSGKSTQDYCTQYWCHDLYHATETSTPVIKDFFTKLAPVFSGSTMSWNGYEHNALLMNLDGKEFVNIGFLMDCASEFDSRMAGAADLDLDGRVDLVFEHNSNQDKKSHLHFLRNQWQDEHHWIGVHLDSKDPAVSPVGAKIVARSGDRTWVQQNVTGHSVWAQHPNTIHFGLGDLNAIDSLEVTWPNGKTTEISKPALDQYHVMQIGN